MAPSSPVVARWELSYRIRRRREMHGKTGPELAKELGFSRTYWPKVERDQRLLPPAKMEELFRILEFSEAEQTEMLKLQSAAKQRAWWNDFEGLFDEDILRLWGLEAGAEEISTVDSLLIPGLLQTEDYARALITSDTAFIRQLEVAQRVEARMRRQQRLLDDSDPLRLNAVVSEAALRQMTGGSALMRGQLRHLVKTITEHRNTIDFRILPFSSETGAIFGSSTFYILDFARPEAPTLGWSEGLAWSELFEDPERVRVLTVGFKHVQSQAMTPEDSLTLIEQLADRIETPGE